MKFFKIVFIFILLFSVTFFSQEESTFIENTMVFPGCEGDEEQLEKCFFKNVQLHIAKNFDAELPSSLGLEPGRKKGFIVFVITENGTISNIRVKAEHPKLEEECKRALSNFPKVIPKKVNGIAEETTFSTPFYILVNEPITSYKNLSVDVKTPVYKDCKGTKEDLKKCFSVSIQKNLKDNFNPFRNKLGLDIGDYQTNINFIITKEGKTTFTNLENDNSKSELTNLSRKLVKKIILNLPDFKPGESKGKPLKIACSIPFKFSVTKELPVTTISNNLDATSFMIIEDVPVFPGCRGNKNELKTCFSKKIQKHFARMFDSDLPNRLGLEGGRKIIFIGFLINKDGLVKDINVRAPHPDIKEEVIRVMRKLPKFVPGKQRGKPVAVKYSIPLTIIVGGSSLKNSFPTTRGMPRMENRY